MYSLYPSQLEYRGAPDKNYTGNWQINLEIHHELDFGLEVPSTPECEELAKTAAQR
jgi:hypothetical protein